MKCPWIFPLALTFFLSAGCAKESNDPVAASTQPPVTTSVGVVPKPLEPIPVEAPSSAAEPVERVPEVLLSSRKQGVLIVAIDFAGTAATDKALPLDDRRQYVARHAVDLYLRDFAAKEKPGQKVKFFTYSVPHRDDYARGDFRNVTELAIFDTTQDNLRSDKQSLLERLGTVEWRAALK